MPSKTEHELEELLRAAPVQPPWIRPWEAFNVRGIGSGDVLANQQNLDLVVAAVNALPALLAERKRLREGLYESLVAMVSQSEGLGDTTFARGLKHAALSHAIEAARSLLAEQEATDEQR